MAAQLMRAPAKQVGSMNVIYPSSTNKAENVTSGDLTDVVVKSGKKLTPLVKGLIAAVLFGVVATAIIVPSVLLNRSKTEATITNETNSTIPATSSTSRPSTSRLTTSTVARTTSKIITTVRLNNSITTTRTSPTTTATGVVLTSTSSQTTSTAVGLTSTSSQTTTTSSLSTSTSTVTTTRPLTTISSSSVEGMTSTITSSVTDATSSVRETGSTTVVFSSSVEGMVSTSENEVISFATDAISTDRETHSPTLAPSSPMAETTSTTPTTALVTTGTTSVNCELLNISSLAEACLFSTTNVSLCNNSTILCSPNYPICTNVGYCITESSLPLIGASVITQWVNRTVDDEMVEIRLPFSITLYNYSTSNVTVTSNGVICLGGCATTFTNTRLPSGSFNGPTAFGFWDDLLIKDNSNRVSYSQRGLAPNRSMNFEFHLSDYANKTQLYHFQIIFYENMPNLVRYVYFNITDDGRSATIGTQRSGNGPSLSYSFNRPKAVRENFSLLFETNLGQVLAQNNTYL